MKLLLQIYIIGLPILAASVMIYRYLQGKSKPVKPIQFIVQYTDGDRYGYYTGMRGEDGRLIVKIEDDIQKAIIFNAHDAAEMVEICMFDVKRTYSQRNGIFTAI